MNHRCFAASLLFSTVTLFTAQACGPDFYPDVFVHKLRPDNPKLFAAGKLGVLLPTYPRMDLAVAFRYLNGGVLSPGEQLAYHPTYSYTDAEWESAWDTANSQAKSTADPVESWQAARAKYAAAGPKIEQERNERIKQADGSTYQIDFLNCQGDAFKTAVLTLESRAITWGGKSAELADWVKGQDAVFSNCTQGDLTLPAAAAASSSALLKADRAYQVAAAEFYGMQLGDARRDFEAIGEDGGSPWRGIAKYLAARCLVRQAFSAKGTDSTTEVATFDAALMQQAAALLESLLKEDLPGVSRQAVQSELDLVRLRTEPLARLHELSVALAGPKADPQYSQHLADLTWYLNANLDQVALRGDFGAETVGQPGDFSTTYHDVASLRGSSTLVDWLITFQSPAKGAAAHALAEWRKTQHFYWLLAAITKATGKEPEAAGLVDAAGQVKPDSPAWESLTYHRLRLLIAMGKTQEARTLLNQTLPQIRAGGRDSSVNAYLGLRMRAAENLGEFLTYAPRKIQARVLLLKGIRQHFIERDCDYKRFRVETQQPKDAKVVPEMAQ